MAGSGKGVEMNQVPEARGIKLTAASVAAAEEKSNKDKTSTKKKCC